MAAKLRQGYTRGLANAVTLQAHLEDPVFDHAVNPDGAGVRGTYLLAPTAVTAPTMLQQTSYEGTLGDYLQKLAPFSGCFLFEGSEGHLNVIEPARASSSIGAEATLTAGSHRILRESRLEEREGLVRNRATLRQYVPGVSSTVTESLAAPATDHGTLYIVDQRRQGTVVLRTR